VTARLVLFLSAAITAAAQPAQLTCNTVAQPPNNMRAEGLTELAADIVMDCTGGSVGAAVPVQLTLSVNTQITSRLLSVSASEALLLVDDPAPGMAVEGRNLFRGQISGSSVAWSATVIAPGSGSRRLRVTNVRVNASALFAPTFAAPPPVVAQIDLKPGQPANAALTVGMVEPGFNTSLRRCDDAQGSAVSLNPTSGLNTGLLEPNGSGRLQFNVRFREAFLNAFQNRAQENGTTISAKDPTGRADHGTRLRLAIGNVPPQASVFVTTGPVRDETASSQFLDAILENNGAAVAATASAACPYSNVVSPIAQIPVSNGVASAEWEITAAGPRVLQQASFGVVFAFAAYSYSGAAAPTLNASFSPTSTAAAASASADIPRFQDTSIAVNVTGGSVQTNLTFYAVAGGATPPSQNLRAAAGFYMNDTATTDKGNWLSAAPDTNGGVVASVSTVGLTAGNYYGQIIEQSFNSLTLQVSNVLLHLLSPGQALRPIVRPEGFLFPAFTGDTVTDPQNVALTNLSGKATGYMQTNNPRNQGSLQPGESLTLPLTETVTGRAAGLYQDKTGFSFSDGSSIDIPIRIVVSPLPRPQIRQTGLVPLDVTAACTPNQLAAVFTNIGNSSPLSAGSPAIITAKVYDNCSQPLTEGRVVVSFSNGDQPITLAPINAAPLGNWSGLWVPAHNFTQVTLTLTAQNLDGTAALNPPETAQRTAGMDANVPVFSLDGVLSLFSFTHDIASGGAVAIFGNKLATGTNQVTALPLPSQLGVTRVQLDVTPLPLVAASDDPANGSQVNAVLPYDLIPEKEYALIVQRGNALSAGIPIRIPAVRPTLVTPGGPGTQGGVFHAGTLTVADANAPAAAGDFLEIYCTGLGPVTPPVQAGMPAPVPPATIPNNAVRVTIGGVEAKVVFAGLTPGTSGIYQVNIQMPAGVAPGNSVPLIVSVGGQASPPGTIAVK